MLTLQVFLSTVCLVNVVLAGSAEEVAANVEAEEAARMAIAALGKMNEAQGAESGDSESELDKSQDEVARLEAQVEELKKLKAKKKSEHTQSEIAHLKELMANIEAIEKESNAGKAQDESIRMAEAMAKAFGARKEKEDQLEKAPLQKDALHACILLATRHYINPDRNKAPAKGNDVSTDKEEALQGPMAATEVQALLARFAAGRKAVSPIDVGDVAYSTVFRAISACLNTMDQERLEQFNEAGGFDTSSQEALDEQLVNEAEGRKTAMTLTGNVFKLGFDQVKWKTVRRIIARYYSESANGGNEEVKTGKDEL